MLGRTLILSACLALTSGYLSWATGAETTPSRLAFSEFPLHISEWSAVPHPILERGAMGLAPTII